MRESDDNGFGASTPLHPQAHLPHTCRCAQCHHHAPIPALLLAAVHPVKQYTPSQGFRSIPLHPANPHAPRRVTSKPGSMDDCRVALQRARAVARPTEAAQLNAAVGAALVARAAGESQWGSNLPPLFLQLVLELLQWEPAVCASCGWVSPRGAASSTRCFLGCGHGTHRGGSWRASFRGSRA